MRWFLFFLAVGFMLQACAVPVLRDVFQDCPDCPEMVVVPAGSFLMGSPGHEKDRKEDEGPQHRVTIPSAFAVGKYEVTFDEWGACVAAGGCGGYQPKALGLGRGNRPVIYVSWLDAKAYVGWLSRRTGHRYRLLSEAEWEYASRAGTTTPFSTGPTITTDQANFDGNYTNDGSPKGEFRKKTLPVGSFSANGFGLHDVHGNVWEWVEDCWHRDYVGAPTDGRAWTSGCGAWVRRVVRGGSWYDFPWYIRSAYRVSHSVYHPNKSLNPVGIRFLPRVGFRVAKTLDRYPEPRSFADPDVITGFVRIFEGVCKKQMEALPASERQELAEILSYNNMTAVELCECSGQTIFESFTEKDLDQFMRDSSKYGKSIAEYEPWKTRIGRDILRCVTGNWPSKSEAREITPPKPSITDGSVPESSLPATYRDKPDIKVYARHPSGMTWTASGWHSVRAAMENAHFKCQRRYGDPCTVVYVGPFRLAVMSEETREQTLMAYEEAHRAYRARNRIYGALIVLARDNLDDDNTAVISPAPTRTELAIRVDVGNADEIDAVFSQLEQAGMIEWRDNSLIVPNVEALSLALRSDSAGVRMETEQKVGELKRILREAQASQPNQ